MVARAFEAVTAIPVAGQASSRRRAIQAGDACGAPPLLCRANVEKARLSLKSKCSASCASQVALPRARRSSRARSGAMPTPPSLQALSFDALLANVSSMTGEHVSALPEHVQLELFEGVLARGALNETVLGIFQEAARKCAPLAARIRSLNLKPLPPRPPATRNRWLGDNPSWY
jgi:hypothetical protein